MPCDFSAIVLTILFEAVFLGSNFRNDGQQRLASHLVQLRSAKRDEFPFILHRWTSYRTSIGKNETLEKIFHVPLSATACRRFASYLPSARRADKSCLSPRSLLREELTCPAIDKKCGRAPWREARTTWPRGVICGLLAALLRSLILPLVSNIDDTQHEPPRGTRNMTRWVSFSKRAMSI